MPFEFVDATQSGIQIKELDERLAELTQQLKDAFREKKMYQVLEGTEIDEQIKLQLSRYDLRDCNGCDQDIAKAAGADYTAASWIRMASALIQSITVEIRDGKTSEIVLRKSADIQGSTQSNWKRGVRYIVRRMSDK